MHVLIASAHPSALKSSSSIALLSDPASFDILSSMYIQGGAMQVSKWGNSLAVRLPAEVVEMLELKVGDQIEVRVAGAREFEVDRDRTRERALERLRRSEDGRV